MSESTNTRCSLCGATTLCEERFLGCQSWVENNPRQIRIWKVCLCKTCYPKSYQYFLRSKFMRSISMLGIMAIMFVAAIIGSFMIEPGTLQSQGLVEDVITGPKTFMNLALMFAVVLGFIAGAVGGPIFTVTSLLNFIKYKKFDETKPMDDNMKEKSFIGEAERVLKILNQGKPNVNAEDLQSKYPLPREGGDFKIMHYTLADSRGGCRDLMSPDLQKIIK